jgi:hypothetical protein
MKSRLQRKLQTKQNANTLTPYEQLCCSKAYLMVMSVKSALDYMDSKTRFISEIPFDLSSIGHIISGRLIDEKNSKTPLWNIPDMSVLKKYEFTISNDGLIHMFIPNTLFKFLSDKTVFIMNQDYEFVMSGYHDYEWYLYYLDEICRALDASTHNYLKLKPVDIKRDWSAYIGRLDEKQYDIQKWIKAHDPETGVYTFEDSVQVIVWPCNDYLMLNIAGGIEQAEERLEIVKEKIVSCL